VAVQTNIAKPKRAPDDPLLTKELVGSLLHTTNRYWNEWVGQSTYNGSWKESVLRSALALKLLVYEPTGAVVASPTFSLPEYIGGVRNWDYRASWIRDSSFTLYALIRLGFTEEANSYLEFIFERLRNKNEDGSLQIMYTIHGGKDLEEVELPHLDGHKGSRPVRIGNGAANHIQLDIYGELMDCIYLGQKFGKPLSFDDWVLVRELVDFVVKQVQEPDLSIWEVRDKKRHFTYSKVMLWVALDRGLRLAEKRSLPCPNRATWLTTRDQLYEEIMEKAWNKQGKFFGQSYEDNDILDSAVLIMPLVFFMHASDPRFVTTLNRIMKTPEKGGLTSNGLVYRYDVRKSEDGVGGEEGTFCLCTLWCIEALTRAAEVDKRLLPKAVNMFEDFLLYLNHVGLCTEEISDAGEALGNAVQGFTHVTLISAAYNLSRTLQKRV
jgi:GH15 family glucan-1,4-alpha-glucosidase